MERKDFLRRTVGLIGTVGIIPLAEACRKDKTTTDNGSGSGGGTSGGDNSNCTVSPTETEGPFPTKTPSGLVRTDIRDDRTGVVFTIKITIKNRNNSCSASQGAIVDIWHCDKDGYYSEYGGTGMQTINYTGVHFLRGRQTTDANGLVTFTSIFPGWYSGRATHIHVHIYNASGTSLLVTQIAFPEGSSSAVATVNGSGGVSYGYTKGMSGYTYNANDNVFSDDTAGIELAAVSGGLSGGYTLTHTINVNA
ncbi:MAG: intradiol ring-cleavage dioxygenase [Chitinophagaceae bacterium]|nr:intradiol ring-cleavage dioxygenase [Chitinophagaceae bacterium]